MKFESTYKPIVKLDHFSLATVLVIVIVSFYLMLSYSNTTNENKLALSKTEPVKEKVEVKPIIEEPQIQNVEQEKSKPVQQVPPQSESSPKVVNKKGEVEFDLDFSGKSIRKIKNYLLPDLDASENDKGNCKLNFTIKPDGSVAKIFPVAKTNTKLELNAIFAMRKWSFEPLKKSADQVDQQAVITFLNRAK